MCYTYESPGYCKKDCSQLQQEDAVKPSADWTSARMFSWTQKEAKASSSVVAVSQRQVRALLMEIESRVWIVDLIELAMKNCDMILGMDQLSKYGRPLIVSLR